jgi:hypothetical protein
MSPPSMLTKVKDDPSEEALSGATSVEVVVLRTLFGLAQAKSRFLTPQQDMGLRASEQLTDNTKAVQAGLEHPALRLPSFHRSHTRSHSKAS